MPQKTSSAKQRTGSAGRGTSSASAPSRVREAPAEAVAENDLSRLLFTQFAIDHAGDAVYFTDLQGRVHYANDEACRQLGYTKEELLRFSLADIDPTITGPIAEERLNALDGGAHVTIESRHRRRDGSEFPVEVTSSKPVYLQEAWICSFVRDISERKQSEHWAAKLGFAVEHASDAIVLTDSKGNIQYANVSACRSLGYSPAELRGMRAAEIDVSLSAATGPAYERIQALLRHRKGTFESHHRRKDGSTFPVEVSFRNAEFDGVEYSFANVRDISERKQAEQQLRFTLFALDRAGEAAYFMDGQARIRYVNEAACRQLGYSSEELLGMTVTDIDPSAQLGTDRRWTELTEDSPLTFETRHRRKDGTEIPVEVSSNRLSYQGEEFSCSFVRDITDRKIAARKMEDLQFAMDNAVDGVFLNDRDGDIYYANASACRTLGYEPGELNGMNLAAIDPEFTLEEFHSRLEGRHPEGSAPRSSVHLHRRKDGTLIPVEISFNTREVEGTQYFCSFARDVTERQALERQQEQLNFAIDGASDAVYILDEERRFMYVNEAACAQTGYSRAELLNMNAGALAPDLDVERRAMLRAQAVSGKRVVFETFHQRKDGTRFPVEISYAVFDRTGNRFAIAVVRDITERKALEREKELMTFAMDSATDAVYILDTELRIHYANRAACAQTGRGMEELLHTSLATLDTDMPLERRDAMRAEAQAGGRVSFETIHRRKDGTAFPVEVSFGIARHDGAEYSIALVRDITERKALERQREQLSFAMDRAMDAVYIVGRDRQIRYVNQAASVQTGYSREELLRMSMIELAPQVSVAQRDRRWEEARAGRPIFFETYHQRKDGTRFPVEMSFAVTVNDGVEYSISVVRDISQRKVVERQNRELRFVIDNAMDAVFLYNRNGLIRYANASAARELGYSAEELAHMSIGAIDTQPVDDESETNWQESLSGKRIVRERTYRRKDGSTFPVEISHGATVFDGEEYGGAFVRNITERREAMRRMEELNVAVENSPDGMFLNTYDGRIYAVNESTCRMLGYSREELLSMKIHDIDPTIKAGVWENVWSMHREPGQPSFESVHRRKDGTLIPVDIKSRITRFGDAEYSCSFVRDITERKQAQLRSEMLQFGIDNALDPIYFYNDRADIIHANKSACQTLGYTLAELKLLKVFDIDPEMTAERWKAVYPLVKSGEVGSFESRNRRKDGKEFLVEVTPTNISFQGIEFGCSVNRDITERRRTQQRLLMTQFAIDNAGDAIFFTNRSRDILYANETACRMLGYAREELALMTVFDISPDRTADGPDNDRIWTLLSDHRPHTYEARHKRKDGSIFPIELHATMVEFGGQDIVCSVVRDITERNRTQEQLRRYQEHLEELVESRTTELRTTQEELMRKERLAVLGQLTGMVGHELRNPMGTIETSLYIVEQEVGSDNPTLRRALDRAQRNIRRCDKIIDELLSYARIRPLDLQVIPIDEWLAALVGDYDFPAAIDVQTRLQSGARVNIEPERFRRCLINGISNACDAMLDATTGERPKRLLIATRLRAAEIEISIEDTGPGIPPEQLERIFEPLYSTRGFGIGLGLPIVDQIIKQHKGSVRMESKMGEGARMILRLPRITEQ